MKNVFRIVGWLVVTGITVWGAAALWFSTNAVFAIGYVVAMFLACLLPKIALWRRICVAGIFGAVLVWWLLIPPSNNRQWQPDVATLPYATIDGDKIKVFNIRSCNYRTDTDFDVAHYDGTYDLSQLRTIDLYLCYWGSPFICHTMMSFGFADGRHLCFSIETRKEKGESYSAIKGFFKQYELTYVVADERDAVRLRTNYRHEDVYCYRLKASPSMMRSVLVDYLKCVNELRDHPEWYNALTDNCTTNIRGHTKPYAGNSRWNWRLLINGYLDELIYRRGAVNNRLPFHELKKRSLINDRAIAAGDSLDFSQQIRQGLPQPE